MLVQISTNQKEKKKKYPIGVDLGTTHTVVSLAKDKNDIEVLCLDGEKELIPSVVGFDENSKLWVCGSKACHLETYFSSFKPHLYQPLLPILSNDGKKSCAPYDLTLIFLTNLKQLLNDYFQDEISDIVLTVPAYFDDTARQATKDAAHQAGFKVLRLLSEPTAAALTYHLDDIDNGFFLVFDFGGGTFDCSLLNFKRGIFNVKATKGDCFLGGDDIDKAISYFWNVQNDDQIILQNESCLKLLAKKAKQALSNSDVWNENNLSLSREELLQISYPIVEKTISICKDVLFDADISIDQINYIVLVGGSSKLLGLHEKLALLCGEDKILCLHDPDIVVSKGAALQALKLFGGKGYILLDVSPLSLGIETFGGLMEVIIPRNSTIPCSFKQKFTTYEHNQTAISFHVLQGESDLVEKCVSLGRFVMKDLPAYPAGYLEISVEFNLDSDGLLKVTALEEKTGKQCSVNIHASYGLSDQRKKEIMLQAYSDLDADFVKKNKIDLKMQSLRLIKSCEFALEQDLSHISEQFQLQLEKELENLKCILNSEQFDLETLEQALNLLKETSALFAEEQINKSLREKFVGKDIS